MVLMEGEAEWGGRVDDTGEAGGGGGEKDG